MSDLGGIRMDNQNLRASENERLANYAVREFSEALKPQRITLRGLQELFGIIVRKYETPLKELDSLRKQNQTKCGNGCFDEAGTMTFVPPSEPMIVLPDGFNIKAIDPSFVGTITINGVTHGLQFKQSQAHLAMLLLFRKFDAVLNRGGKVEITQASLSEVAPIESY